MNGSGSPDPASARPSAPPVARRDRVLLLVLGAGVAASVLCGVDYRVNVLQPAGNWLTFVVLEATQVMLAAWVVRTTGLPRASRRFWTMMGVASIAFGFGSLSQLALVLLYPNAGRSANAGGPVQSIAEAVGALLLVIALLTAPLGLQTRRERFRFCVDAATVLTGAAVFVWRFSAADAIGLGAGGAPVQLGTGLFIPAAFLVVLFGVLKLVLGGTPLFTRRAAYLGCLASALMALAVGMGRDVPLGAGLTWSTTVTGAQLANVCYTAAIWMFYRKISEDITAARVRPRRSYSPLPYVAIVATYGLLVWVLGESGLTLRSWVVLGGAIVSTALVVVRQLAALVDNDELVVRLDGKIKELAAAQEVLHRALDERDELAAQLRHQAYHDTLTGLPNRALYLERLSAALDRARVAGGRTTVMILDLDDFKPVNDRLGHVAGDLLLQEIARRLTDCVPPRALVARLGGDEFAVLLTDPGTDASGLAEAMAALIRRPVAIGNDRAVVRVSIGSATDEDGSHQTSALMHEADVAMYVAKRAAKSPAAPGAAAVDRRSIGNRS